MFYEYNILYQEKEFKLELSTILQLQEVFFLLYQLEYFSFGWTIWFKIIIDICKISKFFLEDTSLKAIKAIL